VVPLTGIEPAEFLPRDFKSNAPELYDQLICVENAIDNANSGA